MTVPNGQLEVVTSDLDQGLVVLGFGTFALAMLVVLHRDFTTLALIAIAIWSFCRFYYFAFYVIQHYVDSSYRFAGLLDFLRYCLTGQCVDRKEEGNS